MSTALRSFFLMALFAGIMTMQMNLDTDLTSTRYFKNFLELAVHDAALALDEQQLAGGYIVFDQVQGEENLRKSLQFHLRLSTGLIPEGNSFLKNPVKLKYLQFLDEKTLDPLNLPNTISFPYQYVNEKYNILERINGPSIIVVLETISPRYFVGEGTIIRQAVVYEYDFQ